MSLRPSLYKQKKYQTEATFYFFLLILLTVVMLYSRAESNGQMWIKTKILNSRISAFKVVTDILVGSSLGKNIKVLILILNNYRHTNIFYYKNSTNDIVWSIFIWINSIPNAPSKRVVVFICCDIYFEVDRVWASLITQLVKNLPAMQETLVQFLGQKDPLKKG